MTKVRVKGTKQKLTLTGKLIVSEGQTYYYVKERVCAIPVDILEHLPTASCKKNKQN